MQEDKLKERLDEIKTNQELLDLLDNDPPETWIKTHPKLNNFKYLPIDKVEFLLKRIFKLNYKIEVLNHKEMFNAATVSIRVHYRELEAPFAWFFHDGVGADEPKKVIETKDVGGKKEKLKTDVLEEFAIASSLPLAKTLALKDACDHFGKLFGSDLNRVFASDLNSEQANDKKLNRIKELYKKYKSKIHQEDKDHIERIIETESSIDFDKVLDELEKLNNKQQKQK